MTPRETFLLVAAAVSFAQAADNLPAVTARAESGDDKTQLDLAIRYRDGKGVEKDHVLAMQWTHRAADRGHADAMDFVGHAYLRGSAIKGNATIAFGYFKAATGRCPRLV